MVKYRLMYMGVSSVEVSIDSDDPNAPAKLQYSGDDAPTYFVRTWLESQAGIFGHLIGLSTTAIDLKSALSSPQAKEQFQPQLIEGQEVLNKWKPFQAEDGVCT